MLIGACAACAGASVYDFEMQTGVRFDIIVVPMLVTALHYEGVAAHLAMNREVHVHIVFPNFATAAAGHWDAELNDFAARARAAGKPLWVRLFPGFTLEAEHTTAIGFQAGWRRIAALLRVAPIFLELLYSCPSTVGTLLSLYPGDDYVDAVGYCASGIKGDLAAAFNYTPLLNLSQSKPLVAAFVSSSDMGSDSASAAWLTASWDFLATVPRLRMVDWKQPSSSKECRSVWQKYIKSIAVPG